VGASQDRPARCPHPGRGPRRPRGEDVLPGPRTVLQGPDEDRIPVRGGIFARIASVSWTLNGGC